MRQLQLLFTVQDIGNRFQGNILVVSHGEVRALQHPQQSCFNMPRLLASLYILPDMKCCEMQAINRSIVRLMPWVTVVEAKHCCYSVARRTKDADGDWGPWELDVNQLHKIQVLGL